MERLFPKLMVLSTLVATCFLILSAQPVSAQYAVSNLVSNDNAFTPVNIDPNLVNGWGLASFPNSPCSAWGRFGLDHWPRVDKHSFFVRQIEGELAKTPSWWLGVAS